MKAGDLFYLDHGCGANVYTTRSLKVTTDYLLGGRTRLVLVLDVIDYGEGFSKVLHVLLEDKIVYIIKPHHEAIVLVSST